MTEPQKPAAGSGYTNIFPLYLMVFEFFMGLKVMIYIYVYIYIFLNIKQPRPLFNAAAQGEYVPICAHLEHRCVRERGLTEEGCELQLAVSSRLETKWL